VSNLVAKFHPQLALNFDDLVNSWLIMDIFWFQHMTHSSAIPSSIERFPECFPLAVEENAAALVAFYCLSIILCHTNTPINCVSVGSNFVFISNAHTQIPFSCMHPTKRDRERIMLLVWLYANRVSLWQIRAIFSNQMMLINIERFGFPGGPYCNCNCLSFYSVMEYV
jgi:hypothetical protein